MKTYKYVLKKSFAGVPSDENIELIEFELKDELDEMGKLHLLFDILLILC